MDHLSETGLTAGEIYSHLSEKETEEIKLIDVKKAVNKKHFDFAVGWLLRENKISLLTKGRSTYVKLS